MKQKMMRRSDFLKIVLLSSVLSAGIVWFFSNWPAQPATQAETMGLPTISEEDVPLTEDERVNIDVYQRMSRSVVNITSTTIEYTWFFEAVPQQGVGSGFIIDDKGHLVTNFHVIREAKQIDVTLSDETTVPAEVVGADPINDLAVLKIECPPSAPCIPVKFGNSDGLQVGQKVLAIGNPFGLQRTLTTGIVSSVGRTLRTDYGYVEGVIQTDAAINPGNSGGPLLNSRGEVVGINTAIFSRSGDSAGIGFSVPVTTLQRILPDLIEYGKVLRPWFGVRGRALRPGLAKALDSPVEEGFLVEAVENGSTADRAGIRGGDRRAIYGNSRILIGGDIVVELAGRPIRNPQDLISALEDKKPGQQVEIVFYRDGRKQTQTIDLIGPDGSSRRFRF